VKEANMALNKKVRITTKEAGNQMVSRAVKFNLDKVKEKVEKIEKETGPLRSPPTENLGPEFKAGQKVDPKLLRKKMNQVMLGEWV
jgi:hypothetical protein